jgi:hypothetical protein
VTVGVVVVIFALTLFGKMVCSMVYAIHQSNAKFDQAMQGIEAEIRKLGENQSWHRSYV